jgi:hypothetical protein
LLPVHSEVEWVWMLLGNGVCGPEMSPLGGEHKNQPPATRVVRYFYIWEYFASCSFRSGMDMFFSAESCSWAGS